MSKFRPLHDCVVLRRLTAEEKTVGGIIIPDAAHCGGKTGHVAPQDVAKQQQE